MPTGTITALRAQAHDSQRVNLFIDDEFVLGISLNTLAREGLAVGMVVDAATWERLEATEQADRALQRAIRLLEQRPRSEAELRQRLQRLDFRSDAITYALDRLRDLGLLDDAAFSRTWIENRRTFRPRGSLALRDELRRKGVARDLIDAALADADGEDEDAAAAQEIERARDMAQRAMHRYANTPDWPTFQRRMGGYLQRRGFSFDTIRPILKELWQPTHNGDDPESDPVL
ncbi:regulatory protein RecX [Oscillochloris trichoides DG-6]|uniref:Regulatory protein RecX n=1 Tax=Oscillochloris trichoides DG-6 TaxID=765420 RepID=E1ICJ9_9CHLR|nr:RecX family transcriptional regulator [Oscillochloris trichoides]EFO81086.1 regulatory protein RecX [Oscillochloris trichoides DG-6]